MNKFTVGMAVKDDPQGLLFTLAGVLANIPRERLEIIVVNNSSDCQRINECTFVAQQFGATVIHEHEEFGTHVRNLIFENAKHDFVVVMDSHIVLYPGALENLYEAGHASKGIYHGPIVNHVNGAVCYDRYRGWHDGYYGIPKFENKNLVGTFRVSMAGFGLFGIQKKYWAPFIKVNGWGGEEGFHHDTLATAGIPCYCVAQAKYLHSFVHVSDRRNTEQRFNNYLLQAQAADWSMDQRQEILTYLAGLKKYGHKSKTTQ